MSPSLQRAPPTPRSNKTGVVSGEIYMPACDEPIENLLGLVATFLDDEADRTANPDLAHILRQASASIGAVARVCDRLRTLDLDDRGDLARRLPALCADLRACFASAADGPALPVNAPMPAGGLIDELVSGFARRSASEDDRSISVHLERDPNGVRRVTVAVAGGIAGEAAARKPTMRQNVPSGTGGSPPFAPAPLDDAAFALFG
jgi:two-component sensor histidine kinase